MLRVSDEIHLTWNAAATALVARPLAGSDAPSGVLELDETDFRVLDAVVRLRVAGEREVRDDLAAAGFPGAEVAASLARLRRFGVLRDQAEPVRRDDYYMPMLYFRMFVDPIKTAAYLRALEKRVEPGMRVFDVGAGLGIMSVAAARLGARVVALESRPILATAQALAEENGVMEAIEFVRGDLYDPEFAARVGEIDLLVSEFIGDEIFDEEILLKTLWMRRLYLPDGARGKLLPESLEAFAVPIESDVALNRHLAQTRQVESVGEEYGLQVGAVRRLVEREGLRCDFSERLYTGSFSEIGMDDLRLLGAPVSFHRADLESADDALFKTRVRLPIERGGRLDGVVLYFTAGLGAGVRLTSAPWQMRTHWPQILYLRDGERRVAAGDEVDLAVAYVGGRGFSLSVL